MRHLLLLAVCIATPAVAEPGLVVFRGSIDPAPPVVAARDALAEQARREGWPFRDATPARHDAPKTGELVRRGVDHYSALRFDEAMDTFDRAAVEVAATGAAGVSREELSDIFVYRALARIQHGDEARAWDDWVAAAVIDSTRVLDPVRFPPRAVEAFERARNAVLLRPQGQLVVHAAADCVVRIDGVPGATAWIAAGEHFVAAACPGRERWASRVLVDRERVEITAAPPPLSQVSDQDLLQEARLLGASVIAVDLRSVDGAPALLVHRLGAAASGRLVSLGAASPERAVTAAVAALFEVEVARRATRFYQRPWFWGVVGAAAATAVILPFAIGGGSPDTVTVRPQGFSW